MVESGIEIAVRQNSIRIDVSHDEALPYLVEEQEGAAKSQLWVDSGWKQ